MKSNKLFRDLMFVIVICGSIYLLVIAANFFSGDAPPTVSDFSVDRTTADEMLRQKKYKAAIPHLQKLVETDPFDSHALYLMAYSAGQVQEELRTRNDESLSTEIEKYTQMSIEGFEKSLDYPNYSNRARYNLASIYAIRHQDDKALSTLREAVENGFYTRTGLAKIERFSRFKDDEAFKSIVSYENQNQLVSAKKRRGSVKIAK